MEPLHYQCFGEGPDLVFLHGFLGSGDNFWPHAQVLKDRYRCWLLDLPGHGRSPHLPHYTMGSLASAVFEFLQFLQLGPVDLVGHSLGGKVAAALAQAHPSAVRRLILADITPTPTPPRHGAILHAMRTLPLDRLTRREDAEPYLRAAEPLLDVRRFLLKNLAPAETGGWVWKPDIEGFERDEAAMLMELPDKTPFLGPTLLLKGLRSDYVTDQDILLTRALFPNLTVETMDAGHWLHAELPQLFVEKIAAFLT